MKASASQVASLQDAHAQAVGAGINWSSVLQIFMTVILPLIQGFFKPKPAPVSAATEEGVEVPEALTAAYEAGLNGAWGMWIIKHFSSLMPITNDIKALQAKGIGSQSVAEGQKLVADAFPLLDDSPLHKAA